MTPENLTALHALTKTFAQEHALLCERLARLNDEVAQTRRRLLPGIKSAAAQCADARGALTAHIQSHAGDFETPRTVVLEGIKVGMAKGKGKIDWDDDAKVVQLIRKHLPDQADILIKTEEIPAKTALQNLSVADLRRIGISVEESGDRPLIKPATGDIEKIVNKLLSSADTDTACEE